MEEMNKELELAQLSQAWADLHDELKKNNKINFEEFEKAFSKTYALLSKESAEEKLDKKCVEMILNAFLFASFCFAFNCPAITHSTSRVSLHGASLLDSVHSVQLPPPISLSEEKRKKNKGTLYLINTMF